MPNGLRHRQSFDSLRTPFRRNLPARDTPYLLGVVLEEGAVQTGSEAVNKKIFQGDFRCAEPDLRPAVAHSYLKSFEKSEIFDRTCVQSQRIVEEPAPIEYSRKTPAKQHDRVGRGRCEFPRGQITRLALVMDAR